LLLRRIVIQEYLEEINTDTKIKTEEFVEVVQGALGNIFPKLHPTAFGLSVGIVVGILFFLATWLVLLQDSAAIQTSLALFNQFFPGYTVTILGSFIGLAYGFLTGFVTGWLFAFLRNAATAVYMASVYRSAQEGIMQQFFDHA